MERTVAVDAQRTSGGQSPLGSRPRGAPASVLQSTPPPSAAGARRTDCPAFKPAAAAWCSAAMGNATSAFAGAAAMLRPNGPSSSGSKLLFEPLRDVLYKWRSNTEA